MSIITLKADKGEKYRNYLRKYREVTGKEPGPLERTEAFFCATSTSDWDLPYWYKT